MNLPAVGGSAAGLGASGSDAAGSPPTSVATVGSGRVGRLVDIALVVACCVLAAAVAVVAVFFLPLYLGSTPFPISVLAAAGAMIWLPRACFSLVGALAAAFAPVIVWFVVTAWLAVTTNALYPQLAVAVRDWRLVLLLAAGVLGAALSIGRLATPAALGGPGRALVGPGPRRPDPGPDR